MIGPYSIPGAYCGDSLTMLRTIPDGSIHCCVTSPPYWGLRSYLADDDPAKAAEMGAESTLTEYVAGMVALFAEVRRVLRDDGTCWLNLGDCYAGTGKTGGGAQGERAEQYRAMATEGKGTWQPPRSSGLKPKDLCMVPYRVALALQADGWWLRDNIVWHKPNPMPSSVTDRCTPAHESVFLLTKSARYWYDADAVQEPMVSDGSGGLYVADSDYRKASQTGGAAASSRRTSADGRNKRNVWTIPSAPYKGSHYAVMPPKLIEPCIKAGCPVGGIVLDPFMGSGTVGMVAENLGRKWLGFDLDERNMAQIKKRTAQIGMGF